MALGDQIREAFGNSTGLQDEILAAIRGDHKLGALFDGIASYTISQQNIIKEQENIIKDLTERSGSVVDSTGNPSKKRKLEHGDDESIEQDRDLWRSGSYSTVKELSFTIPQRKKLTLELGDATAGLRARHPVTNAVEFGVKWSQVQHVVCLPLPEKAQPQHAFCIFPTQNLGIMAANGIAEVPDQISWTVPDTKAKPGTFSDDIKTVSDESIKTVMVRVLNKQLETQKLQVIEPQDDEVSGKAPKAQSKGQNTGHVKAHQGNKEGFLFFLPTGIVWAFKKPLIFFAFDAIDSISYSSIVQRTFSLNIETRVAEAGDELKNFEFSIIDQAEFPGIDGYIKRHGLADASMAEQRRAKKLNINGNRAEKGAEDDDGPGELEKAAIEAEKAAANDENEDDEEDDENFDPGSEGESEGEGTSEEEEGSNRSDFGANGEEEE
ncbi:MAG: hypothetical protein Q9191_004751 [Dirinaria sp. TL-2023a]